MSGHALWQDGGRTCHLLTQQHHLHVRCRLSEEMFYCHKEIIIPLRFAAMFFSSSLPSKTRVLQGLLNCGVWNVCLCESDLVRSLGEEKKKKKHSQIPERVSFPFCRIILCGAWTLHLDPSYLCDHSPSFLFVPPPPQWNTSNRLIVNWCVTTAACFAGGAQTVGQCVSPHSCRELLGHAEDKEGKEVDKGFFFFLNHGLCALRVYFTFPADGKQTQQFVSKHMKLKNPPQAKLNTIILGLSTIRNCGVTSLSTVQFVCLAVALLEPTKFHLITIKHFGNTPWNVCNVGYRPPFTLNPIKLSGVCCLFWNI